MVPSSATIGSRDRWPRVGTVHSVKVILTLPGMSLGAIFLCGGKWVAMYLMILSCASGVDDRSIMVPISSFQSARL